MKRNWLYIGIISLLLMLVALVATFVLQQRKIILQANTSMPQQPELPRRQMEPGGRGMGPFRGNNLSMRQGPEQMSQEHFEEQMRIELGFTDKQLQDLKAYRKQYHQHMTELWGKMHSLQKDFMVEISKEKSDQGNIEEYLDQMAGVFKEQQLLKAEYLKQLKTVSNPEQRVKLEQLLLRGDHRRFGDTTGGHRFKKSTKQIQEQLIENKN